MVVLKFVRPPHLCKANRSYILGLKRPVCEWCEEHARRKERMRLRSRARGRAIRHPLVEEKK